jgi:Zn finger protein HypA/HybF involved in hydrogenase expression
MDSYEATGIAEGFIEAESEEQVINAWQHLVNTGLAWQLQGTFGRTANSLIEQGVVMIKCPTCEEMRYIENKGCTDTICPEFEIIKEEVTDD